MKELRSLTEKEFNTLKEVGLLNSLYPDAPEEYSEIKGKRPKPLKDPNFNKLVHICEQYIDSVEDPEYKYFKDAKHYIFEEAIGCIYGPGQQVWDYINSFDY